MFQYYPSKKEMALAKKNIKTLLSKNDDKDDRVSEIIKSFPKKTLEQHLLQILFKTAEGKSITIIANDDEISTQKAADLLNVSRPFLISLLEEGKIPFRKVGSKRRVLVQDVLAFKEDIDQKRLEVLKELADLDQELGLE